MTDKKKTTAKKRVIKKKLVLPVLNAKFNTGDEIAFKALSPMTQGKPQKNAKEGEKPADLLHAINIDTGEEGHIIVPAVVKSTLDEIYPDNAYVNCCFLMVKGDKPKGKRYYQYQLDEIEE